MTKRLKLTTRLNIQFVCIVSILMVMVTAYSQWVILEEKKITNTAHLRVIVEYLIKKMPAASFVEIAERQGAAGKSTEEQVLAINKELQPLLANVLVPEDKIKFGIYSRQHQSLVVIGPDFDRSLLIRSNPSPKFLIDIDETALAQMGENKHSLVWYGATAFYYRMPIRYNGNVIGYAFAVVNMTKVYSETWRGTINAFLGGFIALLVVIMLFQEGLIRLKKDLTLFAEEMIKGRAGHFESELPELTPILKHISEQTEKMTHLNKLDTIGEMAAGIAHEVRNPMTTVRGYLQYMSEKAEFRGYKEQLFLMIDELDRANSIITEFLSLAKNHVMDFRKSNLNKVITEIFPLLQADAMRSNCQVEIMLVDVPGVLIDERSMRQLILNMVRNAIEAMPQGGKIEISTGNSRQKVSLVIKDQGTGIPPELIERLGTPFVTTKATGSGLGLAICYRIAQRHGATISVDSKPGKGTVFTLEFDHV
jgi:signal transduction histidine kinase